MSDDIDDDEQQRVRVPTTIDDSGFGLPDPASVITVDVSVADQWDARRWRRSP